MKRFLLCLLTLMVLYVSTTAQDNNHIKNPALGIHFFFNDFKSASAIRSSSLGSVLRDKKFGKIKDMSPGLAINYIEGLSNYFDVSATLGASFQDYPFEGRSTFGNESLLLEGDVSILAKLLSDRYAVTPFLSAGIGASKYKGYYGAFIPVGGGLQFNFFNDAFIFLNSQYRIRVTDNTNYHFFYSVGICGNINKK